MIIKEKIKSKTILSEEVIKLIRKDTDLFGKVASVMGISPLSLPRCLRQNHAKLTQADTLKVIREHMKVKSNKNILQEIA